MQAPITCTGLSVLILLAVAGCATPAPAPTRTPLRLVIHAPQPDWDAMVRSAADQVRRCYRAPRVGHTGRQIVTRLRVFLTPEGAIAGLPMVVAQEGLTPTNRLYATRMAEAAIQSVVRCAPLQLPDLAGEDRIELDLTFSPLASA